MTGKSNFSMSTEDCASIHDIAYNISRLQVGSNFCIILGNLMRFYQKNNIDENKKLYENNKKYCIFF